MSAHSSEDEGAVPEKIRRFQNTEEKGQELLPIKVGSKVIRQFKHTGGDSDEDSDGISIDDYNVNNLEGVLVDFHPTYPTANNNSYRGTNARCRR